jgi:hypothetical protein
MRSEEPGPPPPDQAAPEAPEGPRPPEKVPEVALDGGGPRRLHVLSPVFFATRHAFRLWPLALLVAARR